MHPHCTTFSWCTAFFGPLVDELQPQCAAFYECAAIFDPTIVSAAASVYYINSFILQHSLAQLLSVYCTICVLLVSVLHLQYTTLSWCTALFVSKSVVKMLHSLSALCTACCMF